MTFTTFTATSYPMAYDGTDYLIYADDPSLVGIWDFRVKATWNEYSDYTFFVTHVINVIFPINEIEEESLDEVEESLEEGELTLEEQVAVVENYSPYFAQEPSLNIFVVGNSFE